MLFVNDFENAWGLLHQMQREMLRAASLMDSPVVGRVPDLVDEGDAYGLTVELPGVAESDLEVRFHEDVLSVRAVRKTATPEGYHRRMTERGSYEFQRSYQVPGRIDPDRISADLKQGVLTVRLVKAAEVQPLRIPVQLQ